MLIVGCDKNKLQEIGLKTLEIIDDRTDKTEVLQPESLFINGDGNLIIIYKGDNTDIIETYKVVSCQHFYKEED